MPSSTAAVVLTPQAVSGPAGAQLSVPIVADLNGDNPDTLLIHLDFDTTRATAADLVAGPGAPGKLMDFEPAATGVTILIFGGTPGGIADGAVLANLVLNLDAAAAGQSVALTDAGSEGAALNADPVAVTVASASIDITASSGNHTADVNQNWRISLSELLRVIQFYNLGALFCQAGTEDGYAPGSGDESCDPHDSDYLIQDWSISLSELLRLIQLYNAAESYHAELGTEDGFAVGPF